jgi:hypothetical protein
VHGPPRTATLSTGRPTTWLLSDRADRQGAAHSRSRIAVSALPRWPFDIADVFPVRHLAAALLTAYNPHTTGAGFAGTDLIVVTLWGAGGLAIALRRFSWVPLSR